MSWVSRTKFAVRGASLSQLVTGLCGIGLFVVALVGLLDPRNSWFVFDHLVVLATFSVGIVIGLTVSTRRHTLAGRFICQHPMTVVALGTAVTTALAAISATASLVHVGWDAGAVIHAAEALVAGRELDPHTLDYFARFPNNIPLLSLEMTVLRVGSVLGLSHMASLVAGQVLMYAVVAFCLGYVAQLLGHPSRILPTQFVTLILLGLSPHLAAPYSDIPAAACVAIAVLGLAQVALVPTNRPQRVRTRHIVWTLVSLMALSVGSSLKPFVGVVLVAIACVATWCTIRSVASRSWAWIWRGGVAGFVSLGLVGATLVGVGYVSERNTTLSRQTLADIREPFPVELWLASGTFDTEDPSPVRRYGAYNQELVDLAASIDDPDARRDALRDRVAQHVGSRDLAGNISFFARKVAWVWGDGTFWAFGEGTDSQQPTSHTSQPWVALSEATVATGDYYITRASLIQGLWLAFLLLGSIALLAWSRPSARPSGTSLHALIMTWALAIGGLTVYLTFFEARPRYLVAMLPVLVALVVAVWPATARRSTQP